MVGRQESPEAESWNGGLSGFMDKHAIFKTDIFSFLYITKGSSELEILPQITFTGVPCHDAADWAFSLSPCV